MTNTTRDSNPQDEMSRFLHALFHSLGAKERVECRWKHPKSSGGMDGRRFFANTEELARVALALGPSNDVFIGAAPRFGEVGTKDGVRRVQTLWGDYDFKNEHSPQSRANQLRNLPCVPSMVVLSGGGCHTYWLLNKPIEGPEDLNRAEMVMTRIAEGLDGDPVQDRSRVLRIPGSYNRKTGKPRAVRLAHCDPDLCYTLDELEAMAESLPQRNSKPGGFTGKVAKNTLSNPIPEGQRNIALTSVAGSLRDRGLDEDALCVVLLEVNRLRCEPPLPEHEVLHIGRSVGRYQAGSPRCLGSSAKRIFVSREAD